MSLYQPTRPTRVNFGYELVAYGTEAAAYKALPGKMEDLRLTMDNQVIKVETLESQSVDELLAGAFDFGIELTIIVHNWEFFRWLFGTVVDSGAGPYTHTMSWADIIPSLSFEVIPANLTFSLLFTGCKTERISVKSVRGQPVKATISLKAKSCVKDVSPATPIDISPVTTAYNFNGITIDVDAVSYAPVCPSIDMEFSRDLELVEGMSSLEITQLAEGMNQPRLQFELAVAGSALIDLFLANTKFNIDAIFSRGTDNLTIGYIDSMLPNAELDFSGNALKHRLAPDIAGQPSAIATDDIAVYA